MTSSTDKSTLIYTFTPDLLENDPISFNDVYLLIRSLHSYKVLSVTPKPDQNIVVVEVGYNANLRNIREKMGTLTKFVNIAKSNPNIELCEYDRLAELRQRFNVGASTAEENENEAYGSSKKRKYKKCA